MSIIFLFVSVIILFVYDSDRYEAAATSGKELYMTTIYVFQSLPFVMGGSVWDILAVPGPPPLLFSFRVNNIVICSKVSFCQGLCCSKTGKLTRVGWGLYDTGSC